MVSIHRRGQAEEAMDCGADQDYVPSIVTIPLEILKQKADAANDMYESCVSCGRRCLDNRAAGKLGKCNTGIKCMVSSHFPHFGEELCLRGTKGSGTIFFTNCNLKCIYCQNYDISQNGEGYDTEDEELAEMMMELQKKGCHNINFVSPTHVVAPILRALVLAKQMGLKLPIIYNTGGYDSPETLGLMDGVVDVYMPDMKYSNSRLGKRFSKIDNYPEVNMAAVKEMHRQINNSPEVNMAAVKEMHRQVGDLVLDPSTGLAKRGLLVRHLVLPHDQAGSELIADFIAKEIGPNCFVDVMAQYYPEHKAIGHKTLGREITQGELEAAVGAFTQRGLHRLNHRFDEREGCRDGDKLAVLMQKDMDW